MDSHIENQILRMYLSDKDKAEIDCLICQIDSLTGYSKTK